MLLGSINHVSLTVSDFDEAMKFFRPFLEFLGYTVAEGTDYAGSRVIVNVNEHNGTAFNIWQAKPGLADHPFEVYEPGLHHVSLNAATHEQVDQMHELVPKIGGEILEGPAEFPFALGGYYAVYFLGPDRIKLEFVHMPELERAFEGLRLSTPG